jgi:hypothetical protein
LAFAPLASGALVDSSQKRVIFSGRTKASE